jgi:hypothetical protein
LSVVITSKLYSSVFTEDDPAQQLAWELQDQTRTPLLRRAGLVMLLNHLDSFDTTTLGTVFQDAIRIVRDELLKTTPQLIVCGAHGRLAFEEADNLETAAALIRDGKDTEVADAVAMIEGVLMTTKEPMLEAA